MSTARDDRNPRPAAIIQDDHFTAIASATICAFTTDPTDASFLRIPVEPTSENGLTEPSRVTVDKITTIPRSEIGDRICTLSAAHRTQIERALVLSLGIGS